MTETQRIEQALAPLQIELRPIQEADQPFLARVYASTREEELLLTDWSDEQKRSFLAMQFDAQHHYYQENYTGAAFQIILSKGQPAGRLYLDHWTKELRLVDIALLPEYRRQGIGSAILHAVLAEGQHLGLPVRIHVEMFNPALHLYARLGFQSIGTHGAYYLMEWTPQEHTHHA